MGGVLAAYLTTVGIQFYRWWTKAHTVPPPVGLFGAAGVYGACALAARADARFGATLAWGVTVAAYLAPTNAAVAKVMPVPPQTLPPPQKLPPNAGKPGQVPAPRGG